MHLTTANPQTSLPHDSILSALKPAPAPTCHTARRASKGMASSRCRTWPLLPRHTSTYCSSLNTSRSSCRNPCYLSILCRLRMIMQH